MMHEVGGATGARTPDLLHAMQMLSQLSYRPEAAKCTAIATGHLPRTAAGDTYHRRVRIDINADVGEWTGDDPARATDAALLPFVTTINVACGAHAGDLWSMTRTVELAAELTVFLSLIHI